MLSPKLSPYEACLDIQSKIKSQQNKISKIKTELEKEAPASVNRKKLNDKISANLKELDDLKIKLAKTTSPDVMFEKLTEEKLAIYLSEELIEYVENESENTQETLLAETVKVRLNLTEELGYIIPKVVFQDDENLNPYEFAIKIRGMEVYRACVYPNYTMYFADDLHLENKIKNSIYDTDLITGKKTVWIEKSKTKNFWEKGINGAEYIARALEYVAVKYVDELLDYSDIEKYIDVVSRHNEFLVANLIPDFMTLSDLKFILTSLIKERVSIKDINYLFEKMNDYAEQGAKSDLLKKVRLSLSRRICANYANENGIISLIEISDKTLDAFMPGFEEDDDFIIKIDGDYAEKLANKIAKKASQLGLEEIKILVPMELRHLFFTLLSNYLNNIVVLTREEIGCNFGIEIVANI